MTNTYTARPSGRKGFTNQFDWLLNYRFPLPYMRQAVMQITDEQAAEIDVLAVGYQLYLDHEKEKA
jgi:hypothetical protein